MNEIPKGEVPALRHELKEDGESKKELGDSQKRDEETPCRKARVF